MKSSKHGTGRVRGNLRLVKGFSIGRDFTSKNYSTIQNFLTRSRSATSSSESQQETSQSTDGLLGRWPTQLPPNSLHMDNWTMYQIQSLRTVSGLRGDLPTESEIRDHAFDLNSRTIIIPRPEVPKKWWQRIWEWIE